MLESIAEMCPAAEWIEREIWELLGVQFEGHPDMRHLLLDDSWPEGNFPLRKEEFEAPVGANSFAMGIGEGRKVVNENKVKKKIANEFAPTGEGEQ